MSVVLLLTFIYVFVRVFVCDRFVVEGVSMVPTCSTGQVVFVNKLLMGARIYKEYDFSSSHLSCVRMPGLRKIHVGDVVAFNFNYDWSTNTIGFKINNVYLKRCVGCPGDTVRINDGHYVCPAAKCIPNDAQSALASTPDSLLVLQGIPINAFEFAPYLKWTIKEFGPLYIPQAGDVVRIDKNNVALYESLIEYETGYKPEVKGNVVFHSGKALEKYEFKTNYYFLAGDNVLYSTDSRYFGLVPEDYIIGIIPSLYGG